MDKLSKCPCGMSVHLLGICPRVVLLGLWGAGFETGFLCIALAPVLALALVGQAGLKLTEICLPLPPKFWY